MTIPFIKYSKVWIAIAAVMVMVCVVALAMWKLRLGIDFTGGSLLEISFAETRPTVTDVQKTLDTFGLEHSVIQPAGDKGIIIRTSFLSEETHQAVVKGIRDGFAKKTNALTEERFETIGAAVSKQLRQRSLWAIILVSMSIIAYVAYAFRKISHPIPSWQYGVIAIVSLLFVVVVVSGVFSALGKFKGVEIDIAFIVAILTVLGYSVNDSIVVYDRVRENLLKHRVDSFAELVNTGLNETLGRSINTVFAVLLPLFALYFFGGPTIHYFALALLLGMAMSTISSIFIACPLLVLAEQRRRVR